MKENITIEATANDFNKNIEKLNNLKNKIENEIIIIDESYDKVFNEVEKSFEKKHEKLNHDEKNMKEKLQNEVTKIKEKLEEHLSVSNQMIRENERIMKGIQSIQKESENMIRILSYVSKINKNQKNLNSLFSLFMKNLKISFSEDDSNIIYQEYYFNGVTPKIIKFENISSDSFKVFWEIDKVNIMNIENSKIKFSLKIKEENENGKFIQVYEGDKMNTNVTKLKENTNYEIKVSTVLNGIEIPCTEIMKIKTEAFKTLCDSIILEGTNQKFDFLKKINEWCNSKKLVLLYRGSRDGTTSTDFHSKCDNKGETICLYKNEKGNIFGGYNPISWNKTSGWIKNDDSFLFTLTNIYNTEPTRFPHKSGEDSVENNKNRGPTFDDIYIYDDYANKSAELKFPRGHLDKLNLGISIFSGNKDNSIKKVNIKEIEVFNVLK